MRASSKTVSIVLSLVLSVGMVTGAYFLSERKPIQTVSAESTEEILRAYAAKDTDADGLHDWQETLYSADPNNAHSLDKTLTDLEAVESGKVEPRFSSDTSALDMGEDASAPGLLVEEDTLTDRFAREFFADYLTGSGTGRVPTENDLITFVNGSIEKLYAESGPKDAYTASDFRLVPGNADTLRAYATAIETVIATNAVNTDQSEIVYFSDAIHGGDDENLVKLAAIGKAYKQTAAAFSRMTVPTEISKSHLEATNAMSRMGDIVEDMANFKKDPLLAFVGVSSYEDTVRLSAAAFADMYPYYASLGIEPAKGEPGYVFTTMIMILAANQQEFK